MEPRFPRTTLFVTAGLLIWAADFLFIYVFAALACARGYAHTTLLGFGVVPFVSAVATAFAVAATVAVVAAGARRAHLATANSRIDAPVLVFLARVAMSVGLLALIAVVIVGLPGFLVRGACE